MAVAGATRLAKAREETTRLMLSGWAMSSTGCPVNGCNNPLFSKPGEPSVMRCPPCGATFECLGEGQFRVNELDEDSPLGDAAAASEAEHEAAPDLDAEPPAHAAPEGEAKKEAGAIGEAEPAAEDAETAPGSPTVAPGFEQRQRRLDLASRMMGQAMLRGMAMLGEGCPECGTPLMRSRDGTRHCMLTEAGECTWKDVTVGAPAAPAAPSTGSGAVMDAGISAEDAAAAFQDAMGGISADEAAGPSARRAIEESSLTTTRARGATAAAAAASSAGDGMPVRIDTDALMARAMAASSSSATVEHKQEEEEEEEEEEGFGEAEEGFGHESGLEAARRRRARQARELDEAADAVRAAKCVAAQRAAQRAANTSSAAAKSRPAAAALHGEPLPHPVPPAAGARPISRVQVLAAPADWASMTPEELEQFAKSGGATAAATASPARAVPVATRPAAKRAAAPTVAATAPSASKGSTPPVVLPKTPAAESTVKPAVVERAALTPASPVDEAVLQAQAAVAAVLTRSSARLTHCASDAETAAALALVRDAAETLRVLRQV